MRLVRTFHPVGHGAFYTEQFYEGKDCKFTAVYDCGGNPEGGMDAYLDKNFSGQKIDYLFISHLHWDHISGIQSLLDKNDIKELKIYLPLLTPEQIIEAFVYNIENHEDGLGEKANQLIIKIYTGDLKRNILEVLSADDSQDIGENDTNKVPFGTVIVGPSDKWIYYPYNTHYAISADFEKYVHDNKLINADKTINFENVRICCNANINGLREKYKGMGHLNEYSMTVYSGKGCLFCGIMCGCDCCKKYKIECGSCVTKANCMYMGDFEATYKNVSELRSFYRGYLCASKTIQVPHHGSSSIGDRYDYGIYNCCKHAIISTGHYSSIPIENVSDELSKRDVKVVVVDSNPNPDGIMNFDV